MSESRSNEGRAIIPAAKTELTLRSTTLISRGLADLARLDRVANTDSTDLAAIAKNQPAIREVTNSLGMKLVLIPAGEFIMGSPAWTTDDDAHPQHRVRITKSFYMGVFTVTQSEYEQVVGNNPSFFSALGQGHDKVVGHDTRRFPVESVSWDDAQIFCQRLSDMEGKAYRLPTEAEWEYACRAGTTTMFYFGDSASSTQANFYGKVPFGRAERGPCLERTTTVGSYRPNAFGLYDMHGNVNEWCLDWHDDNYYADSPIDDPQGPEFATPDFRGESLGVVRGGMWSAWGVFCCSSGRGSYLRTKRENFFGFRIVCEQ